MEAGVRFKIAKALIQIAKAVLIFGSRRGKAKIVVDENLEGIIPELWRRGYNEIKNYPKGTPDQVIHDALNEMRKKSRQKPILLITRNASDFTATARGTEPLYTVVEVPGSVVSELVPDLLDRLMRQNLSALCSENKRINILTLRGV